MLPTQLASKVSVLVLLCTTKYILGPGITYRLAE